MTENLRNFPSGALAPPPAPYGGERDTMMVRADYLQHLISDFDHEVARACDVDWVSDAADTYRTAVTQMRRASQQLADEVGTTRNRLATFMALYDDVERLVLAAETAGEPIGLG